jgi:hypothetical protein
MDGVELGLRAMGAFYVFAGYVATRAALTSHVIDRALAAISATKPSRIETAQSLWLLGAANVILAGGAALVLLLEAAAWIFVASALAQAAYLFVVAPLLFDRDDPPDAAGRQQSTNAFVIYTAATALVLWAAARGRLASWEHVPWAIIAIAVAAAAAHAAYTVWMFAKPLTPTETSDEST